MACIAKEAENEVAMSGDVDWDNEEDVVSGLTSLAICGIMDPVRDEVNTTLNKPVVTALTYPVVLLAKIND